MIQESMPQPSQAHAAFRNEDGFRIDETHLRKLYDLLRTRLDPLAGSGMPTVKVYRSDHTNYVTTNIETLSREDNSPASRIERIELTAELPEAPHVNLVLSSESGISLRVEGPERDSVVALFNDLKNYISKEIIRRRPLAARIVDPWVYLWIIFGFSMLSPLLLNLLPTPENRADRRFEAQVDAFEKARKEWEDTNKKITQHNQEATEKNNKALRVLSDQAVSSSVSDVKLQFLVTYLRENLRMADEAQKAPEYPKFPERPRTSFIVNYLYLIGFYLFLWTGLHLFRMTIEKLSDPYLFLLGKEVAIQQQRASRRERLVWTVLVGFVVGVLGSLAATIVVAKFRPPF